MFDVGDKVVYPHHGAGTVVSKDVKVVLGQEREYLTIKILHNDMTVNVPDRQRREGRPALGDRPRDGRGRPQGAARRVDGDAEELEPPLQAQPRQDEDRRHPRARRGRPEPRAARPREGPLDRREADVRQGEEDPRLRAHVREEPLRGRRARLARGGARQSRQAGAQAKAKPKAGPPPRRERVRFRARKRSDAPRPDDRSVRPATSRQRTWAILVAAGSGERLGADRPKAFAALGGRPLLAESLERLDASEWIDAIVVVAPAGWEEPAILLAEELVASKVAAVVTGGATRARVGAGRARGGSRRRARRRSCTTRPGRSSTTR